MQLPRVKTPGLFKIQVQLPPQPLVTPSEEVLAKSIEQML